MKHFKGILTLLFISLLLSFSYNYISSSGIAVFGNWDRTKGVVSANAKISVVNRDREINSLKMMKEIVNKNKALIIDVRLAAKFKEGHILNARSIPVSEFDDFIGNLYETIAMEREIVVYCSGRECTDSHVFANKLSELGYMNVFVFTGGYIEWAQGGFGVEKN